MDIKAIIQSILFRITKNPNTSIGGGAFGVVAAALFAKVEEMSGCHFQAAIANIDWAQLFIFGICQIGGLASTDANKTIVDSTPAKVNP